MKAMIRRRTRSHRISIRSSLLMFMVSSIIVLCLIILLNNYSVLQRLISEYVYVYVGQTMESVTNEINSSVQYMDNLVRNVVNSNALNQYIRSDIALGVRTLSEREQYGELSFLKKCLFEYYDDRERIPFICLQFNQKRYCLGDIADPTVYDGLSERIDQAIASEQGGEAVHATLPKKDLLLISRHISDLQSGMRLLDIVLALDMGQFSSILSSGVIGESGTLKLVSENAEVLYPLHREEDADWDSALAYLKEHGWLRSNYLRSGSFQEGRLQITASKIALGNWSVVGCTLTDDVLRHVFDPASFLVLPLLCALVAALFCIWMAHQITRPIMKIVSDMKKTEERGFDIAPEPIDSVFKETDYISSQFVEMMRHIRRLLLEVHNAEIELRDAELASLQAQIRPHFIYNTLENINMMLIMREQDDISRVVVDLGDILRYNINPQRKDVALREDLEQVDKYLRIQRFRFGSKLRYQIDLAPDTSELIIEKLLIQPIVENSVIHGVGAKAGGGCVRIASWLEKGALCVRIADDGIGFSPDAKPLEKNDQVFGEGGHIGLGNVQNRIRRRYGEAYGLRFERVEAGSSVVIVLPIVRELSPRTDA